MSWNLAAMDGRKREREKTKSPCRGTCYYNMFPMFRRNSGTPSVSTPSTEPTSRCHGAMHYSHSTFCACSSYIYTVAHAVIRLGDPVWGHLGLAYAVVDPARPQHHLSPSTTVIKPVTTPCRAYP